MKIALIGATGLVGRNLLETLISTNEIKEILVITRRPLEVSSDKVSEIICKDFDNLPRNIKADHFISCIGTTIKIAGSKDKFKKVDYDYVVDFAKIAKENKALGFFVVSAAMANSSSFIFYNKVKGQMEEAIEKLELPIFYSYRPSLLIGDRTVKRSGEQFAINLYNKIGGSLPKPLANYLGTKVSSITSKILVDLKDSSSGRHIVSF
jgi:uncharacterized protein YbjT (DUF2867 family)